MEKGTVALVSVLKDQFTRVWDMWEEIIRTTPDDEWRKEGYIDENRSQSIRL